MQIVRLPALCIGNDAAARNTGTSKPTKLLLNYIGVWLHDDVSLDKGICNKLLSAYQYGLLLYIVLRLSSR